MSRKKHFNFSYPTHQQYNEMVKAIFSRWPYLQRIFNSNYDAIEIYRFRLRTYFKNARKKLVNVIPEVLTKRAIFGKRKSAENDLPGPSIKKGVMAWGVKNYLPPFQEGEDSRLNSQYNLSAEKRDERIIRKLTDLVFPHWRLLLINEMATIQDVVDLYPILKDERQVIFYFSLYANVSKKKISLKVELQRLDRVQECHHLNWLRIVYGLTSLSRRFHI